MKSFRVEGDPKNPPHFSSSIIIEAINTAAKKVGLYDEQGARVVYDCLGQWHGPKPDALIVCYELPFHQLVVANCQGIPTITVSRDNFRFAIEGGCDPDLVFWTPLGVDSSKFVPQTHWGSDLTVGIYSESLVRGGYEIAIEAFGKLFSGRKDIRLYCKDRNGTPRFKEWIDEQTKLYDINLIYDNRHLDTTEAELAVLGQFDIHLYLNRSSTWALPAVQTLSMGIPTIAPMYSGPREYIINDFTGLACEYEMENLDSDVIGDLQKLGMRNFFFEAGYKNAPYWCKPQLDSVMACLDGLVDSSSLRERLSKNSRAFVKQSLTWEATATNISRILS